MRIVPNSEVAQRIVEMFGDKKVVMPSNVVTPSLRAELEKLGVSFKETDNQGKEVKKTTLGERSGVISGNSSSEGLLASPNGPLSLLSFGNKRDATKVKCFDDISKATREIMPRSKRVINRGGLDDITTEVDAVRAVGKVEWKAGVVQSQLSGTRTVILSRWDRPLRIVPDSEVAQRIVEMFGDKQVVMPSNVVTPSLRAELEKLGVPFKETDNQGKEVKKKGATKRNTPKAQPTPHKRVRDVTKLRKDF